MCARRSAISSTTAVRAVSFSSIGLGTWVRRWEESLKALLTPGVLFEELGFRYFGPIDGHDIDAMIETFNAGARARRARDSFTCSRRRERDSPPARVCEKWHALPPDHDPSTGKLRHASSATTYQKVFGKGLVELGAENDAHRRDHRGDAERDEHRSLREGAPGALLRRRHRRRHTR